MITYEAVCFVCDICCDCHTVRHRTYPRALIQVRGKGWMVTKRETKCPKCRKIKSQLGG